MYFLLGSNIPIFVEYSFLDSASESPPSALLDQYFLDDVIHGQWILLS